MLYVAGGYYQEGDKKVFKLVRPTGGLPYVADEKSCDTLFRMVKHHAHLYKISDNLIYLELFTKSGEAECGRVEAIQKWRLSAQQIDDIEASIAKGIY